MDETTAQAIEIKLAEEAEVSNSIQVGFKRLTPDAVIPTKAHPTDSGFDLVASEDVIIEPGETKVVPTGIAVQLPAGFEATVRPRSGVTAKTKLRVQLGTIDNGYGGGIGVIVDNNYRIGRNPRKFYYRVDGTTIGRSYDIGVAEGTYLIRKGDRIAQIVITRLPDVEAIEVFDAEETVRGAKGFGSSGVSTE